jgi:hypothetical protein
MTSSRRKESDEYPPNHRVFNDVKRLSVWWFQTWLDYFPFHIWEVILPIDEVILFKMVKTLLKPPTSLVLEV